MQVSRLFWSGFCLEQGLLGEFFSRWDAEVSEEMSRQLNEFHTCRSTARVRNIVSDQSSHWSCDAAAWNLYTDASLVGKLGLEERKWLLSPRIHATIAAAHSEASPKPEPSANSNLRSSHFASKRKARLPLMKRSRHRGQVGHLARTMRKRSQR
jgi:hypothetical protein